MGFEQLINEIFSKWTLSDFGGAFFVLPGSFRGRIWNLSDSAVATVKFNVRPIPPAPPANSLKALISLTRLWYALFYKFSIPIIRKADP